MHGNEWKVLGRRVSAFGVCTTNVYMYVRGERERNRQHGDQNEAAKQGDEKKAANQRRQTKETNKGEVRKCVRSVFVRLVGFFASTERMRCSRRRVSGARRGAAEHREVPCPRPRRSSQRARWRRRRRRRRWWTGRRMRRTRPRTRPHSKESSRRLGDRRRAGGRERSQPWPLPPARSSQPRGERSRWGAWGWMMEARRVRRGPRPAAMGVRQTGARRAPTRRRPAQWRRSPALWRAWGGSGWREGARRARRGQRPPAPPAAPLAALPPRPRPARAR